jgi:fucose 4-O-acetylase-like acetyltransferase
MNKRIRHLDELKGFVIICVVLGHVLDGYISSGYWPDKNRIFFLIYNIIYSFHMPLCFILSGYFFRLSCFNEMRNIRRAKLRNHILDFTIVYVIFSLIFWGSKLLMAGSINTEVSVFDIFFIWVKPLQSFWYLYVLIAYNLAFSMKFWGKIKSDKITIFLAVISVLSSLINGDAWFQIQKILYYAIYFYIGIQFRDLYELSKITDTSKIKKLFRCFVIVIVIVSCLYFALKEIQINDIPFVNMIVALSISNELWRWFENVRSRNVNLRKRGLLSILGENMMEIYVTHIFITAAIRIILKRLVVDTPAVCIVLSTVMGVLLPISLSIMLKKLKVHGYIFRPLGSFHAREKIY